MKSKDVAEKITDTINYHIPDKCHCVYIDDIFNGLSVSVNSKIIKENKSLLNKVLDECDKKYGYYIESYDFIMPQLFNIYFNSETCMRGKKVSKIKRKIKRKMLYY